MSLYKNKLATFAAIFYNEVSNISTLLRYNFLTGRKIPEPLTTEDALVVQCHIPP